MGEDCLQGRPRLCEQGRQKNLLVQGGTRTSDKPESARGMEIKLQGAGCPVPG